MVPVKTLKFRVFWDVAPCSHVEVDRRFRGAYCLHHQGNFTKTLKFMNRFNYSLHIQPIKMWIMQCIIHTRKNWLHFSFFFYHSVAFLTLHLKLKQFFGFSFTTVCWNSLLSIIHCKQENKCLEQVKQIINYKSVDPLFQNNKAFINCNT
jgi:hypothetical protein